MKRLGAVVFLGLLLILGSSCGNSGVAPTVLIDYPYVRSSSGDSTTQAFYINSYPGSSLTQAKLWFRGSAVGTYSVHLTARVSTFDGSVLGTSTGTFNAPDGVSYVPATFDFNDLPVTRGSVITFTMTSGSNTVLFATSGDYTSAASSPVLITETNGSAPPLDTFRRTGIAIQVTGKP